MAVSSGLKRLLRIRDLEQEQHRMALESALAELRTLEQALNSAEERERRGRSELAASVHNGKSLTRQSALIETEISKYHASALAPALSRSAVEAARRQHAYLAKRMELRQAETLVHEGENADAIAAARQSQYALDEWFRTHSMREARTSAESSREEISHSEIQG